MMKKIVGFVVSMLMICGALVSANTALKNQQSFNIEDGIITVNVPVGKYEINEIKQSHEVTVEGYGRLLIPGKPNLPSKIFSIAIPPGADIRDVKFETNKGIFLPGVYRIPPSSLSRVICAEDPVLYEHDQHQYEENYKSVYGQNNPYPLSIGEVVGTGGYRKYNLVDVRITPFIYYPLSGRLMYYPDITVTVQYTFPEGFSSRNIMIDNLPRTEQIAKEIFINYDQAKNWYPNGPKGREQYDYVIITLDSLTSSVTSLVDWETSKGRSVYVATTQWISSNYDGYDLAAKMRAFLLEKYPSSAWGIQDVCLVGSYSDVPMRRMAQDVGYGQPETDYYYAELSLPDSQSWDANGNHQYGENSDPIDFETEVSVGRIPWSDPAVVQSICEKSVAYEQNNEDSFKKNILLLGAFFWSDTDNAVLMDYKTNPSYNPWMSDWTRTRLYEQGYSTHPMDGDISYSNVKTVWSTGTYAFVDWAGHGAPTRCVRQYPSETDFVNTNTCPYLNDNYPAIIFADACSNADTDYLNIGQAMLKQGGIGFVGSNKVAYGQPGWSNPLSGSSQSMDYYFTSCCTSGNYTQGAALQWSLHEMYTNNLWGDLRFETFEWGSLFGNPDLTMAPVTTSNPPAQPTKPVGKTLGAWNIEYSYTSSTTDPNGDQIFYLFYWGDGSNSGWLGPYSSGQTVTSSHIWTVLGTYEVCVKARDINGAGSPMSEPLTVEITNNTPPNTPTITGPAKIKPGTTYTFNFSGTDDFDQDLRYDIDWGDGNGVAGLGPYHSGETINLTHSWTKKGNISIKAKTTDILGAESEWATLSIVCPAEYRFSLKTFLQHLFETFPNMFPILRQLMGF
jgi:hypothetical protein